MRPLLLAYALILSASIAVSYMVERTACEVSTESRAIAGELSTFQARIVKISEGDCQVSSRVILGTGKVSYYSDWFEGRTMANGQVFHQASRSIAHRSLPFNTVVFMAGKCGPYSLNGNFDEEQAQCKRRCRALPASTLNLLSTGKVNSGKSYFTFGRIDDRGPFIEGREFDLSLLCARELGIEGKGVQTVEWGAILPEGRE